MKAMASESAGSSTSVFKMGRCAQHVVHQVASSVDRDEDRLSILLRLRERRGFIVPPFARQGRRGAHNNEYCGQPNDPNQCCHISHPIYQLPLLWCRRHACVKRRLDTTS